MKTVNQTLAQILKVEEKSIELHRSATLTVDEASKAMKAYAKQKCEEQRHECQIERNKRSILKGGVWYVACEDVLNADEPNFD